jgi:hypothetical protein
MFNKDSFYSKSFVIFIRHPEMLTLDGTPCTSVLAFVAFHPWTVFPHCSEQLRMDSAYQKTSSWISSEMTQEMLIDEGDSGGNCGTAIGSDDELGYRGCVTSAS